MKEKIKNYLILILTIISIVFISLFSIKSCNSVQENITKTDTVYTIKYDTIKEQKIINQTKYKYDTILVYDTITNTNTIYIKDSCQVFSDSTSNYKININAVKICDYNLELYNKTTTTNITKTEKINQKIKYGQSIVIGIQGGYGIGFNTSNNQFSLQPYIGIGISYGFGITF